jgi:hypothetical protein
MRFCGSKLIMFEGIPGSGKSTIAKRVYEYLCGKGMRVSLYSEGSDNPLDLTWHSYMTNNDFDRLISEFPEHRDIIRRNTICEDRYVLIPYKRFGCMLEYNEIFEILKSNEICYTSKPVVSIEAFTEIFRMRWKQYAQRNASTDEIAVFESVLFQHQIHDLLRLYNPTREAIIHHLNILIKEITALNPVILYLTQSNVRETLLRKWKERGKEGSDNEIHFWEHRKQIEFDAMSKLPAKIYVIDNSDYDWDKVYDIVVNILG